MQINV